MIFSLIALAFCRAVVRLHDIEQGAGGSVANVSAANVTPGSQFILMQNGDINNKDGWKPVHGFVVPENYETMSNGETTFRLLMPETTSPNNHYAIKMISNGEEHYSRPWMCGKDSWTPSRPNEQEIKMNSANPSTGAATGAAAKKGGKKSTTNKKKKKNSAASIFGSAIVAISVASSVAVFLL